MSEARELEWSELSAFLDYWAMNVWMLQPEHPHHPMQSVNRIVALVGRSKALDGLKQAVGDVLEASQDVRGSELQKLDSALAAQGLLTLSSLRRRYRSKYQAVLKRGKIRNETEFYLLSGIATDTSIAIASEERDQLNRLLAAFEAAPGKPIE